MKTMTPGQMTTTPLVSIVLPTHNGSRYIRESIQSCLNQSYSNFELIVVDDCSTDDTPDILNGFRDPRIRLIRHARNRKLPAALNSGFACSRGPLLTWTSDDNRYLPNAIARLVAALQQDPTISLVYSGYWMIDADGRRGRAVAADPPESLRYKDVVGASFMYRREVYERIGGYDEQLFRIEDYDYWLRVANAFTIGCIPDLLYEYRCHPRSLTSEESLAERAAAFDALQTRHFGPDPMRFNRVLGEMLVAKAFESYGDEDFYKVPALLVEGVGRNRSFLRNRGVWSILFRSLLKKANRQRKSRPPVATSGDLGAGYRPDAEA